jgi:FtsZ-binding cell division protein ZapB
MQWPTFKFEEPSLLSMPEFLDVNHSMHNNNKLTNHHQHQDHHQHHLPSTNNQLHNNINNQYNPLLQFLKMPNCHQSLRTWTLRMSLTGTLTAQTKHDLFNLHNFLKFHLVPKFHDLLLHYQVLDIKDK